MSKREIRAASATSVDALCRVLGEIAPLRLAESWDNVGLLVGDRSAMVAKVITCLSVTADVVDEAIQADANLIVSHHPLPFKPLSRITADSPAGKSLWRVIGAGIAIYSAHTAYDSAPEGINEQWARQLRLSNVRSLVAGDFPEHPGAGRYGRLPRAIPASHLLASAAAISGATRPRQTGDPSRQVEKIGIACGSGGGFVSAAQRAGCDLLLTGEATFHAALDAEARGITLAMLGHYPSERFAMEELADRLNRQCPTIDVWASKRERDVIVEDRS